MFTLSMIQLLGQKFHLEVSGVRVDNCSSSHADNLKNNFLMLGERDLIHFGSREEQFSINFGKANTKFCLRLHYNGDDSYLFINGKEMFKYKKPTKKI